MARTRARPEAPAAPGAARVPPATTAASTLAAAGDQVRLAQEARSRPRAAGDLPRLVLDAFRLVRKAAPGELRWTFGLTFGVSLLSAGQIYLAKLALTGLLGGGGDGAGLGVSAVVAVVALTLVTAVLASSSSLLGQRERLLGQLVTRSTSRDVFDTTTSVPLTAYESAAFHSHLLRVQTHGLSRPFEFARGFISLVAGLLTALVVVVALALIEPLLLPVVVLTGVPLYLVARSNARSEFDLAVSQSPNFRERTFLSRLLTNRESAKEVRAFDLSPALRARWEARYAEYLQALRHEVNRRTRFTLLGGAVSAALAAGAVGLLLLLVHVERISLAEAGAAIVALRLLATRFQQAATGIGGIYETRLFLEDMGHFLALGAETAGSEAATHPSLAGRRTPPQRIGRIGAAGLTFTYPGADRPALRGVDLEINEGEVVALVGENGSGKTTLASLLAQLYLPDSGRIDWDGVDAAEYGARAARERIAVIFQDFVKYPLTARENIGVGHVAAIDDLPRVREAAAHAGADSFLGSLPDGYETLLNKAFEGGQDLSIGQWQRVAIARAFFRDSPFVILDEPTSALDPRAEADLFARIRQLLENRTVLLISHRFSSVRSADRIYVMKAGRIVEHGTHDELMGRAGLYEELFTMQASAYVGDHRGASPR